MKKLQFLQDGCDDSRDSVTSEGERHETVAKYFNRLEIQIHRNFAIRLEIPVDR